MLLASLVFGDILTSLVLSLPPLASCPRRRIAAPRTTAFPRSCSLPPHRCYPHCRTFPLPTLAAAPLRTTLARSPAFDSSRRTAAHRTAALPLAPLHLWWKVPACAVTVSGSLVLIGYSFGARGAHGIASSRCPALWRHSYSFGVIFRTPEGSSSPVGSSDLM